MKRQMPATSTRLREWRLERGYSLSELSALCGLSPSMLSLAERGRRRVRPHTRVMLARRLGVPVRDLFDPELIDDEQTA